MTKAHVMLRALAAKRQLSSISKAYAVSYKFSQLVSTGNVFPSMDLMRKFRPIIPIDYWFETASNAFKEQVREACLKEDDPNLNVDLLDFDASFNEIPNNPGIN